MDLLNWISIALISATALVYWYFKVSFSYWKSRNVPHIKPCFPYGNVKGFNSTIHPIDGIQSTYNKLKGSGKFCGIYFFTSPQIIVLDLELARHILISDFHNFDERGLFHNEM